MTRGIEGKLIAHDRFRFELKLGYTLNPSLHENKYNVDVYFFIPKSLGISGLNYTKNDFYEDLQSYIRFKTPTFAFEDIANPRNMASPLTRLKILLEKDPNRNKLISELKLFACTIRVSLRNAITTMRRKIKQQNLDDLKQELEETCSGLVTCLSKLRELKEALEKTGVHSDVLTAFRHVEEFVCISVDGLLNSFHNSVLASSIGTELTNQIEDIIKPIIISEYKYRKELGYVTYEVGSDNELFLYRKGFLKKVVNSILFLDTHTQEGLYAARDFIFAIAAGIAMIIATVVTIWAGLKYGSTSIPFVLAIVIGYMAKDRIKDWCKLIFSNKMTRWLSDYKTKILDPETEKNIGICKHAFSFITEKKVPKDIMEMRRHNTPSDFWVPEDIIKYEKDVFISPRPILKAHKRMRDVTDIMRFNIHRFLERMDEAYELRKAIVPETGQVQEFKCARVYHINMVLKLEDEMKRIRLVMNKNGIVRVEEVTA